MKQLVQDLKTGETYLIETPVPQIKKKQVPITLDSIY